MVQTSFLFNPQGVGAPTYEEMLERRKIAHALMQQRERPPKNIGEGLTVLGNSIGDVIYGLRAKQGEDASKAYGATHGVVPAAPTLGVPAYPDAPAAPPAAGPGPVSSGDDDAAFETSIITPPDDTSPPVTENTTAPDKTTTLPPITVDEPAPNEAEKLAGDAATRAKTLINPQPSSAPAAVAPGPRTAGPSAATPVSDTDNPLDFIHARGGHATVLKDGKEVQVHPGTEGSYKVTSPELAGRLAAAGRAFEQETGGKAKYGQMSRGEDVQDIYYQRHLRDPSYKAAPPGRSLHQHGEATDLPDSDFRAWLYAGNMARFGLHFPVKGDAPHVQADPRFAGSFAGNTATASTAPAPNRDTIAQAILTRDTPLTPGDVAQEERMADVTGSGSSRDLRGDFTYPRTSARGDVSSDIAPSGVSRLTGGPGGAIGGSVADTAAQRSGIVKAPPPLTGPQPPVTGPQTAQRAGASVSDAPPPGIGQPPPPMPRPADPVLVQPDRGYLQRLDQIANDPRLDPVARKRASDAAGDYQSRLQHHNDQLMAQYNMRMKSWLDEQSNLRNPQTYYDVERKKRELEFLPNEQRMKTETHESTQAKAKQELIPPPTSVAPGPPGSPTSAQRTGVPTLPQNPGVSPAEWARLQAPLARDAIVAADKAEPQFKEAIKLLKDANAHPGREASLGLGGSIAQKVPGTSAYAFAKIMEQIGGKNFLAAYQSLKGGGSITEIEGTKAEAAQARLATAQSKEDFDKAMIDFETALRQDLETAQRKVNRPVTAWQNTPDDPVAPDKGERRGDKEYIGGNPRDPNSWRTVR